jgi:hypothetical protein
MNISVTGDNGNLAMVLFEEVLLLCYFIKANFVQPFFCQVIMLSFQSSSSVITKRNNFTRDFPVGGKIIWLVKKVSVYCEKAV